MRGSSLQVDDAVLIHEYDSILAPGGSIENYQRWPELRVEALNHALEGIPVERVRYHLCWGSWHGPHAFDLPLAEMIDLMLAVKARYLPDRGGQSASRARVAPLGGTSSCRRARSSYPGVVTHPTNLIEHPELVAERLVRFAELVGP